LGETLFIPLKIILKWLLNRHKVYVVISPVSNYQPHARDRLIEKCELDEIYEIRVTTAAEAKFLTVSMATFATTNKRYTALLVCSCNYQSTAKQHYHRYTCKIIVDAGSSQRSKS